MDCFRKVIRDHCGLDEGASKYFKKVKTLIDKPLDDLELGYVRLVMDRLKCPKTMDISLFYQLTSRLPHEGLNYDDERLLIHFYDNFCNESIKLLGKMVRCRTNVLYHYLIRLARNQMLICFNL